MKRLLPWIGLITATLSIPVILLVNKESQDIRNKAAGATTLYLLPASKSTSIFQGAFTTDVYMNTSSVVGGSANTVTGLDLSVTYDTRILGAVDITLGDFFIDPSKVSVIAKEVSASSSADFLGRITYRMFTMSSNGKNGQGKVATITFQPKALGTTVVKIDLEKSKVIAVNEDTNVLVNTSGAQISIIDAVVPTQTPLPTIKLTATPAPTVVMPSPTPTFVPTATPTPSLPKYSAALSGAFEVPANSSPGSARVETYLNEAKNQLLLSVVNISGLRGTVSGVGIYGPATAQQNAQSIVSLPLPPITNHVVTLTAQQITYLKQGLLYVNILTSAFPSGEIRGQLLDTSPVTPTPVPSCVPLPPCAYEGTKQPDGTIIFCDVTALPIGQMYCPQPTNTPTPPQGCFYQQVQCVTTPCSPVLVCPTKTPTPQVSTPTQTPTITPVDDLFVSPTGTFQVVRYYTTDGTKTAVPFEDLIVGRTYLIETQIQVQNQVKSSAVDTRQVGLELTINGLYRGYGSLAYGLIAQHASGAGTTLSTTFVAAPTNTFSLAVDTTNLISESNETNNSYSLQVPISQQQTKPVKISFRYAGVSGAEAIGSKISVRFHKGTIDLTTPAMTVTHVGSGVYEASFQLALTNLSEGPGYDIILKGEKHVAKKFCVIRGQNSPCTGQTIALDFSLPSWNFDFTGMALEPGDLYPQDTRADSADFDKIKALLGKTCSSLTVEEKLTADLNYDGCVSVTDAFLMRKTLETRYDDN